MKFEWDTQKARRNLANHAVSFEEAATVFGDPLGRIENDHRHSSDEARFVLLGHSRKRWLLAVMFVEGGGAVRLIRARRRPAGNGKIMKKQRGKACGVSRAGADEILPEYDFSRARPNKYASRYAEGSIVVALEPDVASVFPGAAEANEALRALAGIIRKQRLHRTSSRRSACPAPPVARAGNYPL